MKIFLLILFVLFFFNVVDSKFILREKLNEKEHSYYKKLNRAPLTHIHSIVIAIRQNNLDRIEKILYDVSDMNSPNYGQHLTLEEVGNLVQNPIATNAVISWLHENNIEITSQSTYGEYITAQSTVQNLEQIFQTEFYEFIKSHRTFETNNENIQYPESEPESMQRVIRAMSYSIPEDLNDCIHAVFRLISFPPAIPSEKNISLPPKQSMTNIPSSSNKSSSDFVTYYPDYYEYAYPYVVREYYNVGNNVGSNVASQTIYATNKYSFSPSDLSNFQTIFGLNKVSIANYYNTPPSYSECIYTNCLVSILAIDYMLSIANNVPTTYWTDTSGENDFLTFITTVASLSKPTNVYSISYGTYERYLTLSQMTSFNNEAMKLGTRGVTIVASTGNNGATDDSNQNYPSCGYYAYFPASSPYVTAVGGTMSGMDTGLPETTCSTAGGVSAGSSYFTTSGGGFSQYFTAPSFQSAAISSYFSQKSPPQSSIQRYNRSRRAYPDVSMPADNILISVGNTMYFDSGTEASAPIFAGMVSLVNTARIQAGYHSLGWLNPTIYANNGAFTNDITTGDNFCTAYYQCCSTGFWAAKSWDPATGFGSVDYQKFLTYYMAIVQPTRAPTSKPTPKPTLGPTSKPSSSPSAPKSSFTSTLSAGSITGIVFGVIIVLLLIGMGVYYLRSNSTFGGGSMSTKLSKLSTSAHEIEAIEVHNTMHT